MSNYELEFRARVYGLYYNKRAGHYSRWHNFWMFCIVLSGTATLLEVLKPYELDVFMPLIPTVLGIIELVYKPGDKATRLGLATNALSELGIQAKNTDSKEELIELEQRLVKIPTDFGLEDNHFEAVMAICNNQARRERGVNSGLAKIRWYHLLLAHYFTFSNTKFGDN